MSEKLYYMLHYGQHWCSSWMPLESSFTEFYSALICGTPLKDHSQRAHLIDSGIIHIIVVSGAHLRFLEAGLGFLPNWIRLMLLGGYCWLTGWGAPVVRAFTRRMVEPTLSTWHWTSLQVEVVTIVSLLICCPSWMFSRSFLLSWLCGLALSLPNIGRHFSQLQMCAKCYLFLFPFCASSPFTIAINALLVPIIGNLLLPLSIVAAIIPTLCTQVDAIWKILFTILENLPASPPAPWFLRTNIIFWIPPLLHIFLLWLEILWRREQAFTR